MSEGPFVNATYRVVRSSTTVTNEGIVVRRFGPAKHYPWPEITDVRIERIHWPSSCSPCCSHTRRAGP
jgi:Bacterial PH domain